MKKRENGNSGSGRSKTPTRHLTLKKLDEEVAGKITRIIGSGKYAQFAIVWWTIKWCFLAGFFLTALAFCSIWLFGAEGTLMECMKTIWSLFVPIITLGLGYVFGKGQK